MTATRRLSLRLLGLLGAVVPLAVRADDPRLPWGYAWGCMNISKALPFCDVSLPVADRVHDLIGRMTLEEKAAVSPPTRHYRSPRISAGHLA
jgi:hypothetical protein